MSSQTKAADRFDLSRWRVAGNGADMIRPDVMQAFVDAFAEAGFNAKASFPPTASPRRRSPCRSCRPAKASSSSWSRRPTLAGGGKVHRDRPQRYRAIVNCGKPARGMEVEIRDEDGTPLPDRQIGKVWCRGTSVMVGYFRDEEATSACLVRRLARHRRHGLHVRRLHLHRRPRQGHDHHQRPNHWPQDIEWAVEQLPGFKAGDIAAFSITTPGGEETPAVLVQCRTSDPTSARACATAIRDRVRAITGMNCVVELVPPRTLPRTSSGKLSAGQGAQPLSVGRDPALRHRSKPDLDLPLHAALPDRRDPALPPEPGWRQYRRPASTLARFRGHR
jgi:fatty-acyl-CoA synthase